MRFPVDSKKKETIVTNPSPPICINNARTTFPKIERVIDKLAIVVNPVTQTADVDINKASMKLNEFEDELTAKGKDKRIVPIKITSTNDKKIVNSGEKLFLYFALDFSSIFCCSAIICFQH